MALEVKATSMVIKSIKPILDLSRAPLSTVVQIKEKNVPATIRVIIIEEDSYVDNVMMDFMKVFFPRSAFQINIALKKNNTHFGLFLCY